MPSLYDVWASSPGNAAIVPMIRPMASQSSEYLLLSPFRRTSLTMKIRLASVMNATSRCARALTWPPVARPPWTDDAARTRAAAGVIGVLAGRPGHGPGRIRAGGGWRS